jgi:hypothetical protein
MAENGYDPRFDPAFQRGFEGELAAPVRRPAAASTASASRSVISAPPSATPAEQQAQVFARAQRQAPRHGETPRDDDDRRPRIVHVQGEPEAHDRVADAPVPLRSNPFLIILLVLAVALIGAGVYLGSRIDPWYDDVSADGPGFGLLNMLQFGAPLAITLGIATVIAVLVILAVRWRGKPED